MTLNGAYLRILSRPLLWRTARWALAFKAAMLLVLASPGLITPTTASANLRTPGPHAALPFIMPDVDPAERELAVECLADAVYYEAGFEPIEGQRAVAQVVLNRVRDPNFPATVCGVVYHGWQRRTGCQFSFVCDGSLKRRPPTADQVRQAREIARQALSGVVVEEVGTATHYHTDYVDPYWSPSLVQTATIGAHLFYRWPGKAGERSRLTEVYEGGELETARKVRPLRGRITTA